MVDLSHYFEVWCPSTISVVVGHQLDVSTKRSELEKSIELLDIVKEML